MKEAASPLVSSLAKIVSGDLSEAISSSTRDNWQETLAMILTYAKEEEFISLCQQLSAHMSSLNEPAAAILCSICAVDISSLIYLGLQFTKDTRIRSNLSIIEVILILCSMVTSQDLVLKEDVKMVADKLGVLCKELKEQGMESVQTKFLQLLCSVPSAQELLQRLTASHPDLLPGFVPQPQVLQQTPIPQPQVFQQAPVPQPQVFQQAPVQQMPSRMQQAPTPFIPSQPVQPMQPVQPIQPIQPMQPVPRQPVPFIPTTTPIVPMQQAPMQAPAPAPAPTPEPEVEYEY